MNTTILALDLGTHTGWALQHLDGTITSWSWVAEPRAEQLLDEPYALALIRLDGADTSMLHAVAAPGPDAVSTGARVRIRWAEATVGNITDIAAFDLIGD